MADEKPQQQTRANAPASGSKSHLVYVQAPYGSIELGDNLRFSADESPYEVTAEEGKTIQEAAIAHGVVAGVTVVARADTEKE